MVEKKNIYVFIQDYLTSIYFWLYCIKGYIEWSIIDYSHAAKGKIIMARLITREMAKSQVLDTIGVIIDELSENNAPKNVLYASKMLKIVVSEDEIRLIVDESDPIPFKFTPLRKGDLCEFRPNSHKNDPDAPVTRYDSSVKYGVYVAPGKFAASDAEMSNPVDGEPVTKLGINVLYEEAAAPVEMPMVQHSTLHDQKHHSECTCGNDHECTCECCSHLRQQEEIEGIRVTQSPASYMQQVGRVGERSTLDELKIKEDGLPLNVKSFCPECRSTNIHVGDMIWECYECHSKQCGSQFEEPGIGTPVMCTQCGKETVPAQYIDPILCTSCREVKLLVEDGIKTEWQTVKHTTPSIKPTPTTPGNDEDIYLAPTGTPPRENHGLKYQGVTHDGDEVESRVELTPTLVDSGIIPCVKCGELPVVKVGVDEVTIQCSCSNVKRHDLVHAVLQWNAR